MPLIDLKTDLKSLGFGKDRPGGGSSNQPYIQTQIPDDDKQGIPSNKDFLLRGGLSAPINAAKDVSRLTQMFFDLKDPSGLLFTAKENLLSRTSVKTEASTTAGAIYTPLSTLGQAAGSIAGAHLNLLGLDPTGLSGLGVPKYYDYYLKKTKKEKVDDNRLLSLHQTTINSDTGKIALEQPHLSKDLGKKINIFPTTPRRGAPTFMEYGGGPGSILGIGKTRIKFATNPTDNSGKRTWEIPFTPPNLNSISLQSPSKEEGKDRFKSLPSNPLKPINNLKGKPYNNLLGFSLTSGYKTRESLLGLKGVTVKGDGSNFSTYSYSQIQKSSLETTGKKTGNPSIQDFRIDLLKGKTSSTIMSTAPDYKTGKGKNIEERVNLGDPGKSQDVYSYATGGRLVDSINASGIYEAEIANHLDGKNDLVKFSIGVLQNNDTGNADFMHFRSFIDSFDDSYNASWGDTQYVGRGDKFHNYQGFDRSINMSFTVYAQSKAELIPMYEKLNFLASSLAPSYSSGGFMQGNLVYLTMGGYLFKQLGFIKSLTYSVPQESTWEIGIGDGGNFDSNVKELPHMIKVTGLSFTPIHDFLPRKAKPYNQRDTRFIALANNTNKDKSSYSKTTKKDYNFEYNEKILKKKIEELRKKVTPIPTSQDNLFDIDLSEGGNSVFPTP
jgi:hypothetical protein